MAKPLSCFVVTIHTPQGVDYKIVDEKTFTIGRSLEATMSFSDPNISRIHMIVYFKHDRIWVEDQKSANGTFLNGEKILPEKMTPVEPSDQIKLGTSQIVVSFNTFEKCFKKDELKTSMLPEEDREALMSLIQGAHSEAQRVSKLGQEYHDKIMLKADQKAKDLEARALQQQEEILSAAKNQAAQIVSKGEAKAQENFEKLSAELNSKAEAHAQKVIQEGDDRARQILQSAELKAVEFEKTFKENLEIETGKKIDALLSSLKEEALKEKEKVISDCKEEMRKEKENLNFELSSSKEELGVLKNEISEQKKLIISQKQIAEQEIDFLKKEFQEKQSAEAEEKKKELQLLLQKKTQEAEFERDRRWEELQVKIKTESLHFEKSKKDLTKELQDLTEQKNHLSEELHRVTRDLNQYQSQCSEFNDLLLKIKPQYQEMKEQLEKYDSQKSARTSEIERLEKKQALLLVDTQSLDEKLKDLKKDYEAQSVSYKQKLNLEYEKLRREQDTQMDQLKLGEIAEVKKIKDQMIQDLFKEKESISKDILSSLEKEIAPFINPQAWHSNFSKMNQKVLECLEEKTTTLSTDSQSMDLKKSNLKSKQRKEKYNWISAGLVAGMLGLFVGQKAYEEFQLQQDPMKQAALDEAKARAEDLEKRKFNPEQDNELRETYADTVIYTKDFVKNYLDEKFQEEWLKASSDYLLKQWRIEEEKTIQVLSAVNTMVKTLEEKKEAIHPDFVQDGLKKMNEFEAENTLKIKDILGSQVKFEAFRRFEKKFYLNYETLRAPAATEPLPENDK